MASQRQPTAERRRQIAEAALRIMGRKGVKKLTAAELGREVGIADATVFRHFKNKHEIVLAAIEHLHELLFDDAFPPQDPDPLDRLKSFFLHRLELVRARPEMVQFALSDRLAEAAGPEGLAKVFAIMERSGAFVEACLAEAQANGLLDRRLAIRPLALILLGALHTTAFAQLKPCAKAFIDPKSVWETMESLLRSSGEGDRRLAG